MNELLRDNPNLTIEIEFKQCFEVSLWVNEESFFKRVRVGFGSTIQAAYADLEISCRGISADALQPW